MTQLYRFFGMALLVAVLALAGCSPGEKSRGTGTYIDDKTITTKITARLAADPVTKATQIDVETYDGVVQLAGFVDSRESIQRAEEIARETEGVRDVQNNLNLRQ